MALTFEQIAAELVSDRDALLDSIALDVLNHRPGDPPKDHDQSSHGRKGKNGIDVLDAGSKVKTGDYALDDDVPLLPGTATIPDNHVRFFHYSSIRDDPPEGKNWEQHVKDRADSLSKNGIRMSGARGSQFSEPNQIWAARSVPDNVDSKIYVEFSLPYDDPRIGGTIRNSDKSIEEARSNKSDATFTGDIAASEIVAVHEVWHHRVRYLTEGNGLQRAANGEYDALLERRFDNDINDLPASVRRAKDIAKKRGLTANHTPGGKDHDQSRHGKKRSKGEQYHLTPRSVETEYGPPAKNTGGGFTIPGYNFLGPQGGNFPPDLKPTNHLDAIAKEHDRMYEAIRISEGDEAAYLQHNFADEWMLKEMEKVPVRNRNLPFRVIKTALETGRRYLETGPQLIREGFKRRGVTSGLMNFMIESFFRRVVMNEEGELVLAHTPGGHDHDQSRHASSQVKYRVRGTTEDVTECQQCGKQELKKTVALEVLDAEGNGTGEIKYCGTTCAAKIMRGAGQRVTGAEVDRMAEEADTILEAEKFDLGQRIEHRITSDKGEANSKYSSTGNLLNGSYFMTDGDRWVRVNPNAHPSEARFTAWLEDNGFSMSGSPIVNHTPGGIDHDQSKHGNRVPTEHIPWTTVGPSDNSDFVYIAEDDELSDSLVGSAAKKAKLFKNRNVEEGTIVGLRIDIPSFNTNGVYVVTVHDKGARRSVGSPIGYDSIARVKDFKMWAKEDNALMIMKGDITKVPIATVRGSIVQDRTIPVDIDDWTPVGYNPNKAVFFYDKRTGMEVVGGDEGISVGNTVFVKNPTHGTRSAVTDFADVQLTENSATDPVEFVLNFKWLDHYGYEEVFGLCDPELAASLLFNHAQHDQKSHGNRDKARARWKDWTDTDDVELVSDRLSQGGTYRATFKVGDSNFKVWFKETSSAGKSYSVDMGPADRNADISKPKATEVMRKTSQGVSRFIKDNDPDVLDFYGASENHDKLYGAFIKRVATLFDGRVGIKYETMEGFPRFKIVKEDVLEDTLKSISDLDNIVTYNEVLTVNEFLAFNHTPGGHDHDQSRHGGGGGFKQTLRIKSWIQGDKAVPTNGREHEAVALERIADTNRRITGNDDARLIAMHDLGWVRSVANVIQMVGADDSKLKNVAKALRGQVGESVNKQSFDIEIYDKESVTRFFDPDSGARAKSKLYKDIPFPFIGKVSDLRDFAINHTPGGKSHDQKKHGREKEETNSDDFIKWFGNSKIVDSDGNPLVVYHGSSAEDIKEFDPERVGSIQTSDWGEGVYFTPNKWIADGYRDTALQAVDKKGQRLWQEMEDKSKEFGTSSMMWTIHKREGKLSEKQHDELMAIEKKWRTARREVTESGAGKTYAVHLKLEKPFFYQYEGITDPFLSELAIGRGHDGIIITNDSGDWEEIIAFKSDQIRFASEDSKILNIRNHSPGGKSHDQKKHGKKGSASASGSGTLPSEKADAPARVLFEVAPDPNNTQLTDRWKALTDEQRVQISQDVAKEIMPEVFKVAGVQGELKDQLGGYLDDTNPSFAAILPSAASSQQIMNTAKVAGFALSQDSMMAVSNHQFEGSEPVGFITINLPKASGIEPVHDVYKQLRSIDNGVIEGHTTVDGQMLIVDFSGDTEALAEKVNEKLGGTYDVGVTSGYSAFPSKEDYDYASDKRDGSEVARQGRSSRKLRQKATSSIRRHLREAEGRRRDDEEVRLENERHSRVENAVIRILGVDEPVDLVIQHTPGGKDHDQDTHGRKGTGSGSTETPISATAKIEQERAEIAEAQTGPALDEIEEFTGHFTELMDALVLTDDDGDGITDRARVGVAGFDTPPPPKRLKRMKNLTAVEREVETRWNERYESDPQAMSDTYKDSALAKAEATGKAPVFETDAVKGMSQDWNDKDPDVQLAKRHLYNVALHQAANATAKNAFVQHLDTLSPGDEVMITAGGCGAGKGYAQKFVPETAELSKQVAAVWDSAGDQNGTETPWIKSELDKRGLKGVYVYVHNDPRTSWADPDFGVIKRAHDPANGRMVDAAVFADSYVLGARNHSVFYEKHKNDSNSKFLFLKNGEKPGILDDMPEEAININRQDLYRYAVNTIQDKQDISESTRAGGLLSLRYWRGL